MLQLDGSTQRAILLGMLIGDALGVPYEFHEAADLPERHLLEFQPPLDFSRSHRGVPPGTWSDDGAQTLALLASLRRAPQLDLQDFATRLHARYAKGEYTPDGVVFDVGIQTSNALMKLGRGVRAAEAGGADERQNGNGSLMRALGCLLAPAPDLGALAERAAQQSLPTHAHPRSQVCCALLVLTGWHLADAQEPEHALRLAVRFLETHFVAWNSPAQELAHVMQARSEPAQGSGYVVDSFWSAWQALTTERSYESCVRHAVALGNDTDTTACIAGGLAGARWGEAALPERWVAGLQGRLFALNLLAKTER